MAPVLMAALVLSLVGCSQGDRPAATAEPLSVTVPDDGASSSVGVTAGPEEPSPTTDATENGPPAGEQVVSIESRLLAEINAIPAAIGTTPVHQDLVSAASALQRRFGLDETGSLNANDVAVVQFALGQGTLAESIGLVKEKLATTGYAVTSLDSTFDRDTQLGLAALSHDAGRAPDPTLSAANLQHLDEIAGVQLGCASGPEPFNLPTAQAIVDHVEQLQLSPRILLFEPPLITGDRDLDQRIATRAMERGYEIRPEAGDLALVDASIEVDAELAVAWESIRSAAASEGINMFIASGFRSVELQRSIFVDRLTTAAGRPLTNDQVSAATIDEVLDSHAPPGFSKHQTGLAIDLAVPGSNLEQFRQSNAFAWLTANNYENARRYGFVPSYPDGVDGLGPQPEPWEWLWVGTDVLFRCEPLAS